MGMVITLAVLLVIVGGVAATVVAFRRGRLDTSPRAFLRLYLYALAFASFLVLLFGATSLVTAGLAAVAGKNFSYQTYSYAPGPPGPEGKPQLRPESEVNAELDRRFRDDLVKGIAFAVVGGLLWTMHRAGIRAIDPAEVRRRSAFASLYSGGLLAIAGLVTVVTLPWSIYSLLSYYIVPQAGPGSGGPSTQPGPLLAFALVFLPVLAYFLWRLIQRVRDRTELKMTSQPPMAI